MNWCLTPTSAVSPRRRQYWSGRRVICLENKPGGRRKGREGSSGGTVELPKKKKVIRMLTRTLLFVTSVIVVHAASSCCSCYSHQRCFEQLERLTTPKKGGFFFLFSKPKKYLRTFCMVQTISACFQLKTELLSLSLPHLSTHQHSLHGRYTKGQKERRSICRKDRVANCRLFFLTGWKKMIVSFF